MDNIEESIMANNVGEDMKIESVTEPTNENEEKPTIESNKEKRNGKDEKSRKKDDKSIDQILKSLGNFDTPEEKLFAICKKYNEVTDENRKLQAAVKQSEKKIAMIHREKEQCQTEKSKAVLAKSKLESLCRELQRQNKAIKEESLLKIREEEEKRKEVSAKFQSTLAEITTLMAETNEKNVKLHEDNMEIHKKFKSVFDEMDIREQQFEQMHQMMKQELQGAETKLAKVTLDMTVEKENLLKEKQQLLLKLTVYQTKIQELQAIEANLRSQVNMYTDKYEEFQSALVKSNEVFGGFNTEMEKMSKKILKLEKETHVWKSRCEKSNAIIVNMTADKQAKDNEVTNLNKKCLLLQELCKAFQQERADLLVQLKEKTSNLNSAIDEANGENKNEDTQKLLERVENVIANTITNTSDVSTTIKTEVEEQTKEPEIEEARSITQVNESDSIVQITQIESNTEHSESISTETINSNDEKSIVENTTENKEPQPTVKDNNGLPDQEKSLECEKEQVPTEIKDTPQIKSVTANSNLLIESNEKKTEEETTCPVLNFSDDKKSSIESPIEMKDLPAVETNIINTGSIVTNGEIKFDSVGGKKHKDKKKRRK